MVDGAEQRQERTRKERGAFFTPPAIAEFLTRWAVRDNPNATVLDPTCGESVFLLEAGRVLRGLRQDLSTLDEQVFGIDIHEKSLDESAALLEAEGLDARLLASDFFAVSTPSQLGCPVPAMDAVVGNPPFIRYQEQTGESRRRAVGVAFAQGVRLSRLASSWAPVLVHSAAFLKPGGRLAMVLPAELLTVHYAEPVRRWLRERFGSVTLVMFDRLQFDDALESVVLLLAQGTGGCESFSLAYVNDAEDLSKLGFADGYSVTPAQDGKWTDMLLPLSRRRLYHKVTAEHFETLSFYGSPELGTVTGANKFFTLSEPTRVEWGLAEEQLARICPPGTRHLKKTTFSLADWRALRDAGERVWLLRPDAEDSSDVLRRYVALGEADGVDTAYKCQIRNPWWRPPCVDPPDLFFTYMSHRYPRLITNSAGVSFVNSMHGVRLKAGLTSVPKAALPLLALNSVTMLGAELHGRSYGGGILKMEPREAALLPVPKLEALKSAWDVLKGDRSKLDGQLRSGRWTNVAKRVDEVLLQHAIGLSAAEVAELHQAAASLRERRIGQ